MLPRAFVLKGTDNHMKLPPFDTTAETLIISLARYTSIRHYYLFKKLKKNSASILSGILTKTETVRNE
jgi:hypothetical protein